VAAFAASVVAVLQFFDIRLKTQRPAFTRGLRTFDDVSDLYDFLEGHQKSRVLLDITVVPRPEGASDYDHWLEIGADQKIGEPLHVTLLLDAHDTFALTIEGAPFRFEKVDVQKLNHNGGDIGMRIEGLFVVGPVQHLGQGHMGAWLSARPEDAQ
jgi:hypothetical protein